MVRSLMGLEDVISLDVVDSQSDSGWVCLNGSCLPEFSNKPFFIHEVYTRSDPKCTSRVTVPVLWDTKTHTVVSNDSWDIARMLSISFRSLGTKKANLYPASLAPKIDAIYKKLNVGLLDGVYNCGFSIAARDYDTHAQKCVIVGETLNELEVLLARQPFLTGSTPTLLDVRVAMTLLRYDAAYISAFAIKGTGCILGGADGRSDYPMIRDYCRTMYSPIKDEIDWPSFRQYFRWSKGHDMAKPLPDLGAIVRDVEQPPSAFRRGLIPCAKL